jgi:nicotinamidase-related amidase
MDQEITNEINKKDKTALIIWDVQKMLVDGIFNKDEFLENTKKLINSAHKNNIPVFFTTINPLPERFESATRKLMMKIRKMKMNWSPEGMQLAIAAEKQDIVLPKNTASIFIGTNFELMMRNAGITTLVFTGIATEFGIESSARDASNRGLFSVIAKDAVSSFNKEGHERSLKNMESMFATMTTEEILEMWR